jgi:hypothetical protein
LTEDRTDSRVTDPLEELRAALTIDPSPDFAARVRDRIARDRSRGWLGDWRMWALAGAGAVVVAAAAVRLMPAGSRSEAGASAPAVVSRAEAGASAPAGGSRSEPGASRSEAGASAPAGMTPARRRASNRSALGAVMSPVAASRPHELEVLVPPDQGIAVRRMLAAFRDGRVIAPPAEPIFDEATGELIRPTVAEIPLIVVTPLPGPPESSGGRNDK